MLARAAVAVPAGADFVVEGAVDFVLLCAKDGGEVVGHGAVVEIERRDELVREVGSERRKFKGCEGDGGGLREAS